MTGIFLVFYRIVTGKIVKNNVIKDQVGKKMELSGFLNEIDENLTRLTQLNESESPLLVNASKKIRTSLELSKEFGKPIPTRFIFEENGEYVDLESDISQKIVDKGGEIDPAILYEIYRIYNRITPFEFMNAVENLLLESDPDFDQQEILTLLQNFGKLVDDVSLSNIRQWEQLTSQKLENQRQLISEVNREVNNLFSFERLLANLTGSLPYSAVKINHFRISATLLINNSLIPSEQGGYLLDQITPSPEIPFIVYSPPDSSDKPIYRIYTGNVLDGGINIASIRQEPGPPNSIRFTVWTGEKESYVKVEVDVFRSHLEVETLIKYEEIWVKVQNFILSGIVGSSLRDVRKTRISASFDIFRLEYDMPTLLDLTTRDELFGSVIFFNEKTSPYGQRKKLYFNYREFTETEIQEGGHMISSSSLRFQLEQKYEGATNNYETNSGNITLRQGDPLVTVQITNSRSEEIINRFADLFSRLMADYIIPVDGEISLRDATRNEYKIFFGDDLDILYPKNQITTRGRVEIKTGTRKIQQLKSSAADIFASGYARSCSPVARQVTIVSPEEADDIRNDNRMTITEDGQYRNNQVLEFPPSNNPTYDGVPQFTERRDKLHFICTDPNFPYPGLIMNKPNSEVWDKTKVQPCCFGTDQMGDNQSLYGMVYNQGVIPSIRRSVTSRHVLTTDKIARMDGLGEIDPLVNDLLSHLEPNTTPKFHRLGVPFDNNSLIHCVLRAIDDPGYLNFYGDLNEVQQARIEYVDQIRSQILPKKVFPGLLKQEMWDNTDEEILAALSNNKIFLDPALFYRAIEEVFNVNIFVFKIPTQRRGENSEQAYLSIPRSKIFYAKVPKSRHCVLIAQHRGSESDALSHDHCELIVENSGSDLITLFGDNINTLMNSIMSQTINTLEWSFTSGNPSVGGGELTARNIIGKFDPMVIFNRSSRFRITGQIIDNYGKLRGVNIGNLQVVFPPSQPLNVPTTVIETDPEKRIDYATAVKIFGQPNSANADEGLWYRFLDFENGMYVPIRPTQMLSNLPKGPPNPLLASGHNETKRINKLITTAATLKKIIQLLYTLEIDSYPLNRGLRNISVDRFLDRYSTVAVRNEDTAEIYKLENLPPRLPANLNQALQVLEAQVPTFVRGGRIQFFSEKFKNQMSFMLKQLGIKPTNFLLRTSYTDEKDFRPIPFTRTFFGIQNLDEWIKSFQEQSITIRNQITDVEKLMTNPYLVIDSVERIFMIQNVNGGGIDRASNVAYTWNTQKINVGFDSTNEMSLPYLLYSTDPVQRLVPLSDNTKGSPDYVELLLYPGLPEVYAAMLPIL